MNLKPHNKSVTLRSRLLRYLFLPALVIGFAIPAADARPGRDRHHGHHGQSYSRHHQGHPGHHYSRHAQPRYQRHYQRPAYHRPVYHRPVYRQPVYHRPAYISVLPRGYRTVYRGGSSYYYADGCYYRPQYHNGSRVFFQISF